MNRKKSHNHRRHEQSPEAQRRNPGQHSNDMDNHLSVAAIQLEEKPQNLHSSPPYSGSDPGTLTNDDQHSSVSNEDNRGQSYLRDNVTANHAEDKTINL